MFTYKALASFLQGCILVGQADDLPEGALRVARNVRIDRTLNTVSSRVGISKKTTAALGGVIQYLSKLFGNNNVDYSYAQVGTALTRYTDTWGGSVNLTITAGTAPLSDATLPDGATTPVPHKYFAGSSGPIGKDNGTVFSTWGIAPPSAAPSAVALATDLTTTIDLCNIAATWTGTNLSAGPTLDANIKQEGAGSITGTIVASTLGSMAFGPTPTTNLDTLTGGDSLVKNDDYIRVRVRLDRPERLEYMQIDVDLDTSTIANAFRNNFYSAIVASSRFSAGADEWNEILMRKSEFERYGTDSAKSWATTLAFRVRFLTNSLGTLNFWVDDILLRGGVDLEGEIDYTVAYRNSTTKGLGNPPKDSNGAVLWTGKLLTNRQRITVTLSNISSPADAQIDKLWLYRRDPNFPAGIRVAEINTGTASYTDNNSDVVLALSPLTLEIDNDLPPTGETVVYGPGASNRFFMLVNGYRLRFSKAWERNYNRAENWPLDNDAGIGDGSQRALAGVLTATQNIIWTEAATFQVIGVGAENFLPVVIPNSRGIVGKKAFTSGDGRLFFVSQDGLYEQIGLAQHKLSPLLDPFFAGQAVDGNPALNTAASALATIQLQFHPDVLNPMLVMLYPAVGSATPNKRLVVKRGGQTGRTQEVVYGPYQGHYTNFFFDDSSQIFRSLFLDVEDLDLLGGAEDGHVYKLEDHAIATDDSTTIPYAWRTKSDNNGDTRKQKRYSELVIEGTTAGSATTVTAYYNKNTASENLGTFTSSQIATQSLIKPSNPLAAYQDIAIDIRGTAPSTGPAIFSLVGWYGAPVGDVLTFWDSDYSTSPFIRAIKWLDIDMDSSEHLALVVYVDQTIRFQGTVLLTNGRQRHRVYLPGTLRGKMIRVTLQSVLGFELYGVWLWQKPLGAMVGYQPESLYVLQAAA